MLKQKIEFLDNDGAKTSANFYFNLTRIEIIELDADYDDDLTGLLTRIGAGQETSKTILAFFKDLIGRSYGERTEGGKFVKSPELTSSFLATDAYSELLLSIFKDGGKAAAFINGMFPQDIVAQVNAERAAKEQTLQDKFVERAQERVEATRYDQETPAILAAENTPIDTEHTRFRPSVDHMERPAMPAPREIQVPEEGLRITE